MRIGGETTTTNRNFRLTMLDKLNETYQAMQRNFAELLRLERLESKKEKAVQKCAHLVELGKSCKISIYSILLANNRLRCNRERALHNTNDG